MANGIITLGNIEDALLLYHDLPSVVTFRGQTGYGLIVDWQDQETIAPVSEAQGIWKPMYFSIRGAGQGRRSMITASQVVAAVEIFKKNPLFAFLRTATGFGLRLDSAGVVELVSRDSTAPVVFELSHYGGRSIIPALTVQLGSLISLPKWQGGFVYEAGGGKPPTSGQSLLLNRLLAAFDYTSDEALERAKTDLLKEVDRLTLLHTDGSLPPVSYAPSGDVRVVISQELTKLVKGLHIKQTSGFTYTIRNDDVVEVHMTLENDVLSTPETLAVTMNAYLVECMRVFTLYCTPLTPAQRQKLGKPGHQVDELPEIGEVEFEHDGKRSQTEESLIAWRGRRPHFPYEGWMPEKDKTYRVFCLRWGKGFRVSPAPVKYTQRWKDDGDQTISCVEIATDHLFQQREVGVLETRSLATRDGTAIFRTEQKVVFASASEADSAVEETRTKVVPIEIEYSYDGTILWKQIDKREEAAGSDVYPIDQVKAFDLSWNLHYLDADYGDINKIALSVTFLVNGNTTSLRHETTWGAIPHWLQTQLLLPYPLCSCGRKRMDVQNQKDGYSKCELCRSEEYCERCGEQSEVAVINGHLICEDCQQYQKAEDFINRLLLYERREAIANEARKLLGGQAFPKEAGEAKLTGGLEHITTSWTRDCLLKKWFGYSYYYFTDDGVYGTKFSPEALACLLHLPKTRGNDLVELIAWFSKGLKNDTDYFTLTQVRQEEIALPSLEQTIRDVAAGTCCLADRLRASESERIAALEAYQKAEKELPENESVGRLLREAWHHLQDEAQSYAQVLKDVEAAYAEHMRQEALNNFLAREYATCPVCGEEVAWPHLCQEQEALRAKGKMFILKISRSGGVELVKLVGEYNGYNSMLRLVVNYDAMITKPIETELHWHQPSQREQALAAQLRQLKCQLEGIERERGHKGRYELAFHLSKKPGREAQLECEMAGTLYVTRLCKEDGMPMPGQTWICTIVRQIGLTSSRMPVIMVKPLIRADEQKMRERIALLEGELSTERQKQASFYVDQPFDEDGTANTKLAAQLRKLGWI